MERFRRAGKRERGNARYRVTADEPHLHRGVDVADAITCSTSRPTSRSGSAERLRRVARGVSVVRRRCPCDCRCAAASRKSRSRLVEDEDSPDHDCYHNHRTNRPNSDGSPPVFRRKDQISRRHHRTVRRSRSCCRLNFGGPAVSAHVLSDSWGRLGTSLTWSSSSSR